MHNNSHMSPNSNYIDVFNSATVLLRHPLHLQSRRTTYELRERERERERETETERERERVGGGKHAMRFMKLMFNLEEAEFTPLVLELALVTVKFQRNLETWKLAWKPYRQHVSGSEVTCAQLVFRFSFV